MNFICPYCLRKHSEADLLYRCLREGGDCRFKIKLDSKGLIPATSIKICSKKCDQRYVALCPNTQKTIPSTAMNQSMSLALLGGRNSGKTNYIAVLVNEIRQRMSLPFSCAIMECDDSTRTRYQSYFYRNIYKENRPVDSTSTAKQDPLLYTLSFNQKGMFGNKLSSLFLPLYDTAGENMIDEETIARNADYIKAAGGIILLLDPFEIEEIADALKEQGITQKASDNAEKMEVILDRVISLLRRGQNDKILDVPLAIVLTKLDLLTDYTGIIPSDSPLRYPSAHLEMQGYSMKEHNAIDSAVRSILSPSQNFNNAYQQLKSFKNASFFALSSFGCDPNVSDLKKKMRPMRVLDPLLWLLAINGYIKTIK